MSDSLTDTSPAAAPVRAPTLALARWESEGGAGPASVTADKLLPGDAEADHRSARVIALENMVIVLLADATQQQRALAVDMGAFISPRPGYTPHPMTLRGAEAMHSLLERADRFRIGPQG